MDSLDLPELHRFAAHLSIDAGSYLRDQALARASRTPSGGKAYDLELEIKENAADLVTKVSTRTSLLSSCSTRAGCDRAELTARATTQADMHAEAMISDAIRERYPDHK